MRASDKCSGSANRHSNAQCTSSLPHIYHHIPHMQASEPQQPSPWRPYYLTPPVSCLRRAGDSRQQLHAQHQGVPRRPTHPRNAWHIPVGVASWKPALLCPRRVYLCHETAKRLATPRTKQLEQQPSGTLHKREMAKRRALYANPARFYVPTQPILKGPCQAFPIPPASHVMGANAGSAPCVSPICYSVPRRNTSSPECAGRVAVLHSTCTQPSLFPRGNTCEAQGQSPHSQNSHQVLMLFAMPPFHQIRTAPRLPRVVRLVHRHPTAAGQPPLVHLLRIRGK